MSRARPDGFRYGSAVPDQTVLDHVITDFAGKVALVTGASSGVGAATARMFAERGAAVVLAARREPEGEAVAASIRANGGEAMFVRTDISEPEQVEALHRSILEKHGRLDFAVNNAAIEGEFPFRTHESSLENFRDLIDINLVGTWLCMKAQITQMLEQESGAIVNVSSASGVAGVASAAQYAATKWGLVGLTKSAALEYAARGIRINALCPGSVETEMFDRLFDGYREHQAEVDALHPNGRVSTADEQAEIAVWLCSDGASYVVGHALVADGGLTAGLWGGARDV